MSQQFAAQVGAKQGTKDRLNLKDPLLFMAGFGLFFGYLGNTMGLPNLLSTLMATAHDLLLNTALFLMALMVITGALSSLLTEYKVIALLEKILAPFMTILWKLPGRTALAGIMTFFSDNPAVLSFAGDKKFAREFKPIQMASMTNFGTSFGMGFVVIAFMSALTLPGYAGSPGGAAIIGLLGAVGGSIISTRLMQFFCRNEFKDNEQSYQDSDTLVQTAEEEVASKETSTGLTRFMDAMLEGGKNGVALGMSIIPGVLIITTTVFMLTMGMPEGGYSGSAYEGVGLFAAMGDSLATVFYALFGFESPELVAFPISTLGSTGASLSLIPPFIEQGLISGNEIAVFTAISMCWSGFLSTHTCMLDSLGFRQLTGKAILAHTFGGIAAGTLAHHLYILF